MAKAGRKFKCAKLQNAYDVCRRLGADINSDFYRNGQPSRGNAIRVAYWNGRNGVPPVGTCNFAKNQLGYAYYIAGVDDRAADLKVSA